MATIGSDIKAAKQYLEQNDVIGFPTETVYGLAGNALNEAAILKIFEVKNRPKFDPLIVHTHSVETLDAYVLQIPDVLKACMDVFWPGPLTVLLDKKSCIPDLITSGLSRVAVRIPNHSLAIELLQSIDFPLAAPSANPFGYVSPTSALHVDTQLGNQIPYILNGGNCKVGVESTIIGIENNKVVVYRKGGVSIEQLEEITGTVQVNEHSSSNPQAPGMLKSHYAPNKQLVLLQPNVFLTKSENVGYLGFNQHQISIPQKYQLLLSDTGNLQEAAHNLFDYLRKIDTWDIDTIYVSLVPEMGIGRAINDRLRRACAK